MNLVSPRAPLTFTASPLDRAADRRTDLEWLATSRAEPTTRVLPLWRLQPILRVASATDSRLELVFLDAHDECALGPGPAQEVFLGRVGTRAYFARDISELEDPTSQPGRIGNLHEPRAAIAFLTVEEAAILGQAKALLDWHARHVFCSACSAPTRSIDGGYRRHCASCGVNHFPRTDPAAIMLVTQDDHCLLARNKRFAGSNRFSALAGFIEPGESIEEAVRREVFEEVGIRIGDVRYFESQPWPFPSSLMIGCFADAKTQEIRIDDDEIVAARWFERATIRRMLGGESLDNIELPRREAIAFHLIREWAR